MQCLLRSNRARLLFSWKTVNRCCFIKQYDGLQSLNCIGRFGDEETYYEKSIHRFVFCDGYRKSFRGGGEHGKSNICGRMLLGSRICI